MTEIVYTAVDRSLASGHTAGLSYTLDFGPQELLEDPVVKKSEAESYDGTVLAVLHNIKDFTDITSDLITTAELPLWKEFFTSVAVREVFTLDGVNVTLEGKPKKLRKGNNHFTYSFKVRVS